MIFKMFYFIFLLLWSFNLDGNKYFNKPGPDFLESTKILAEIIHPEIFPAKQNIKRWVYL